MPSSGWFAPSGVWVRPYSISAEPFTVTTKDDVRLSGHRLGSARIALVFCHGFLGWHQKPKLVRFQEELARSFTVFGFDFRGHGRSGGLSTFGASEYLDVEAVVRHARERGFERVVTFGGSMGGIAVVRHAALVGNIAGAVAVSTPATWDGHETTAVRRMTWLTATPSGRWFLRAFGARVSSRWEWVESPAELASRIAPVPLIVVHGRDDHFFDEENAWLLYRRAAHPKRLLLTSRFGHAEDGYTPRFAEQVTAFLRETLREPVP